MIDFALARHDDRVKDGYDASNSLASHPTKNPQLQIPYSELLAWGQNLPVWLCSRGYVFLPPDLRILVHHISQPTRPKHWHVWFTR